MPQLVDPASFATDPASDSNRRSSSSNNNTQQLLTQLLLEFDRLNNSGGGTGGVCVLGATNMPSALAPALTMAGRFDAMIEVGLPTENERVG